MLCKPFSCTCTAGQLTPPRISMEQDFGILTAGKKNIWERTLKRQGNLRIKAAKRPGGETTNSNVFFPNSSDDWISISGLGSGASFLPSPRTGTQPQRWNPGTLEFAVTNSMDWLQSLKETMVSPIKYTVNFHKTKPLTNQMKCWKVTCV